MPRKLDHSHLHAETDAEIRDVVFPGVARRHNHALHAPISEAAGDDDPVTAGKRIGSRLVGDRFAVDPADLHPGIAGVPGVAQRLGHGEIGVVQLHIFPHKPDRYPVLKRFDPRDHLPPFIELRRARPEAQFPADDQRKVLVLQHQRRLIERRQRAVFDDAVGLDVAEHGDLAEDLRLQRLVAAQHDDIRRDAHALQFLDGVLGGLGLVLVAAAQKRDKRHMDKERVLAPLLKADLARGLQKGLAFNVTGGAADLGDDHVGICLRSHMVDKVLDLLCDVRDDLHGLSEVLAAPLLVQHVPVDLAGGKVGPAVQVFVDKALVMPQIQIRLAAVLGHIDLAVLIGAHGAGVHIDIGVKLLRRYL